MMSFGQLKFLKNNQKIMTASGREALNRKEFIQGI
jgi:hypothetical protein